MSKGCSKRLHAFGFDIHDVWGLINDYIDNRWPYRRNSADNDLFKRDLLVNSGKNSDDYRISQAHHILNPYAILRFIKELHQVRSRDAVCYLGYSFWVDTGSTRVLEQVQTRSVDVLCRYCGYLPASFLQKNEYHSHVGPVADLEESQHISDVAVVIVSSQEQPQFPFNHNADMGNEIANTCMKCLRIHFGQIPSYGYFTKPGILCCLQMGKSGFQMRKYMYNASTNALESLHKQMGICEGNLEKFATSFNACMVLQDGLTEDATKKTYQHPLSAYLFPATRAGFAIECEASSGSGQADISIYPEPGNNCILHFRAEKIFLELSLGITGISFSTLNRHSVAAYVFNQTIEAQT
ncbi:hypothetical protein COEREDRAFT_90086 [Coemansia reversa NRRL 1564]|uniref:Uncharacterized protein n=1 Tax=Coemansia reversa (strain ATCC 12441 / NRRL 1564) TaxID=763665 RepID=A0A2G5B145_COERN|nr:hypothetical protein COEREDRAFT_90086 [Coemansia reversa NRRL 1564]|eukprot:PIA12730.1 hypothetical protein COEREDRAFT_90086 [Coemansia reversa NRRL 1564]